MSVLMAMALGTALASEPIAIIGAPLSMIPTAATTLVEPPQKDDFPSFERAQGAFMFDDELLPGLTSLVYYGTQAQVGERSGRRVDVVMQMDYPGPQWCWMLTGALRTDSEGTQYVRAEAVVNGKPAEVAVYSKGEIFECENGYQVTVGRDDGHFDYDEKNPGEPWESAAE